MTSIPGPSPWADADVLSLAGSSAIGLGLFVTGWYGASGHATVSRQAPYLNLAIVGFGVFAVGCCVWLLKLRRAVGERVRSLIRCDGNPPDTPPATVAAHDGFVRAPGMARVHDATCPLVAGKPVKPAGEFDGARCGVCRP